MAVDRLGPCRLESVLGSGGMGTVHAAVLDRDALGLPAGTRVAVKVLHPHLFAADGFLERFLREADIGRAVVHPNVVRTFGCDRGDAAEEARCFLVMELVEGQTLRALLGELERVPEELCRHVAREVCAGLAAIHAAGAIHRDLKPDNVLITPEHEVKIMDLGVARLVDESVRLSQTGSFVGSVHYAAPEQFERGGRDVDPRADLHALGVLLYEIASGHQPFVADDVPEVLRRILHERPRRLGEVNPQVSPFFEEVVHTLLAKSRDERFADAGEVASVLRDGERGAWWQRRALSIREVTKRPLRRIRVPRPTAVYGREREIEILREQYLHAAAGDGRVVLVGGEAGIGKTRLVDEVVAVLRQEGHDLDFLFGSYPPGGAATAQGALSTAFREHFGAAGCAAYLPETPLLAPAFDAVLRGEPPPRGSVALSDDSLGTCFVHALRSLAAERPVVVLIDDLHFAPAEARSLFTTLALSVPGHRVLLVGCARPGVPEDWVAHLTRLDHAMRLDVGRLGPKDLAQLLQDAFRSEKLATELGHRIALKSDGNPFFVFEIVRGLREGRLIERTPDGAWASTCAIGEIRIPSSVLDLVNARVAELDEEERDLVDVAACCGFEFDPAVLAEATGTPRVPCLKRLAQIERRHRLVRAVGRRFAFDHHQVQEALYGALPEMLREEYHAALAGALEKRLTERGDEPDGESCALLCEHALKGGVRDVAARHLDDALDHLEKGHLHEQAVELGQRALSAAGLVEGARRVRLLLRLAGPSSPLDAMGRRDLQHAVCAEAVTLAAQGDDPVLHARAVMSLAVCHTRRSENAVAEGVLRDALELAERAGDGETLASVLGNLGVSLYMQGQLEGAREQFERELDLSRRIGYDHGEASATGNLGVVLSALGREAEAQRCREETLELHRRIGDLRGEAIATGNLGTAPYTQGRLKEAFDIYARHLALCRQIGYRQGEVVATCNLANVLFAQGRAAEALDSYQRMLVLAREIGYRFGEATALHSIGTTHLAAGETERGLARLRECQELCRRVGHVHVVPASCGLAIGGTLAARGDAEGARAEFEEALRFASEHGYVDQELEALSQLALLPGGDPAPALAALRRDGRRLTVNARCRVHRLLWRATGDRAHLLEARKALEIVLANVDEAARGPMLARVPEFREIADALREDADGSAVVA